VDEKTFLDMMNFGPSYVDPESNTVSVIPYRPVPAIPLSGTPAMDVPAYPQPMAPSPRYAPTSSIASFASDIGQYYDNQISQVSDQLEQAGRDYRSAYAQVAPQPLNSWGSLFGQMLPMIGGALIGNPAAGIALGDDIAKGQQTRFELALRQANQDPMLQFMAQEQNRLSQMKASLVGQKARAERDAGLAQAKSEDSWARMGATQDRIDERSRLDRESRGASNTVANSMSIYNQKQEAESNKILAAFNAQKTLTIDDPDAFSANFQAPALRKEATKTLAATNKYNEFKILANRYLGLVSNPESSGAKTNAEYNSLIQQSRASLVDIIKEMRGYGANFNEVEQLLASASVPLPTDQSLLNRNTRLSAREWNLSGSIKSTKQAMQSMEEVMRSNLQMIGADLRTSIFDTGTKIPLSKSGTDVNLAANDTWE